MKKIIISIIIILALIFMALIFDWGRKSEKLSELNNIIDENINENYLSNTIMPIIVDNIKDNQIVSNPIKIEGRAKEFWFFENSFPIELVDTNGNILATTTGQAQSNQSLVDFINFTAVLEYIKSTSTSRALIVLNNYNTSGNPEFNKSIFIPVILK
ncbi:MAG: Gmad2 immunoglobulin-like domain-containing protein [bacterium]